MSNTSNQRNQIKILSIVITEMTFKLLQQYMNNFLIIKKPINQGSPAQLMRQFADQKYEVTIESPQSAEQKMKQIGEAHQTNEGLMEFGGVGMQHYNNFERRGASSNGQKSREMQNHDLTNIIRINANTLQNTCSKLGPCSMDYGNIQPQSVSQIRLYKKAADPLKCQIDAHQNLLISVQSHKHNPIFEMESLIISRHMQDQGNAHQANSPIPTHGVNYPLFHPRRENRGKNKILNLEIRPKTEERWTDQYKVNFKLISEKDCPSIRHDNPSASAFQANIFGHSEDNQYKKVSNAFKSTGCFECAADQRHNVQAIAQRDSGIHEVKLISTSICSRAILNKPIVAQNQGLKNAKAKENINFQTVIEQNPPQNYQLSQNAHPPENNYLTLTNISPDFSSLYKTIEQSAPQSAVGGKTLTQEHSVLDKQAFQQIHWDQMDSPAFKVIQSAENAKILDEIIKEPLQNPMNQQGSTQSSMNNQRASLMLMAKIENSPQKKISYNKNIVYSCNNPLFNSLIEGERNVIETEGEFFEDEILEFSHAKVPNDSSNTTATHLVNLKR
ncbi:hypothetical protein FGO68_gene16070 [Halteria grandinella]|uniref:Uncharacterized protein n=1 Tax=Halteria grandinella TaxID=5974 RepID=A0A8J8T3T5_HALGN|nr:hypothetical protein FGO68_gene16070 [Halteria grandinella]